MSHIRPQVRMQQLVIRRPRVPSCFDLRLVALGKLRDYSDGARFVHYRDARRRLGVLLHLSKLETRRLLLEMAQDGLISFDLRGKVWLENRHSRASRS